MEINVTFSAPKSEGKIIGDVARTQQQCLPTSNSFTITEDAVNRKFRYVTSATFSPDSALRPLTCAEVVAATTCQYQLSQLTLTTFDTIAEELKVKVPEVYELGIDIVTEQKLPYRRVTLTFDLRAAVGIVKLVKLLSDEYLASNGVSQIHLHIKLFANRHDGKLKTGWLNTGRV